MMKIDRKFVASALYTIIISVLFSSTSNASGLKLEHSWSSQNAKEWVIGLKATNVREEGNKINADIVLWNSTQTWIFVEQDFTRNKVGQFPVHTQGAYLLGPGYTKNLGTVEFSKGSFLQFNAKTATGVGHQLGSPESNMLLGALAIDLAMRGFFSKELPPNAFDRPLVFPIEAGTALIDPLFYTITSHCSGPMGVFSRAVVMKDKDAALNALGRFLLCTTEAPIRKNIQDWLTKLFSKEVAEKWANRFTGNIGDFLNLPMKATLMKILTEYTLDAPPKSWARIETKEVEAVAQPQIISDLKILEPPTYRDGQTITAEFIIKNAGITPITFDVLTVGGRVNDTCPQDKCPDFEWKENVTLRPNEAYHYKGKLKLEASGNYHFFTAYRIKDGQWNTSIPTAPGVTNTVDINVKNVSPSWLSGWPFRQGITIDHTKIDSDLIDFPIVVKLTSANFEFSKARSDGYDIRFTSSDGISLLKYERERHNSSSQIAEYWVKIPSVSSTTDTKFYIYYGKPDAAGGALSSSVWDSNFKAVWHLKESGSGTLNEFHDSTSNDNHGQGGKGVSIKSPTQVEGKIEKGQQFDGVNDGIALPNPLNNFNPHLGFTIEAWVKTDVINPSENKRIYFQANAARTSLLLMDDTDDFRFEINDTEGGDWKGQKYSGVVPGTYYYLVGTWAKGGPLRLYVNGTQVGRDVSTGEDLTSYTPPPRIGCNKGTVSEAEYWDGIIDEMRISNTARSAKWIKASYYSGNNELLRYGSQEIYN